MGLARKSVGFTCQCPGKMELIQGEAKPPTPCAASPGLAQTGVSRAITGQTLSTSCKEEGSAAVPQRPGGWLPPARAQRWGAHGPVWQRQSTSPGGPARRVVPGRASVGGSTAHGRKPSQQNSANLHFRSRAEDEASGFGASSFPPAL